MNEIAPRHTGAITAEGDLLNVLQSSLSYEPTTGLFHWRVNRRGGARAGDAAGTLKATGHIAINAGGRLFYAHRLAWLFANGQWPTGVIDHIDGDPANNRITNLRDVSIGCNLENQRRAHRSNTSSRFLGVTFDKQTRRWSAKISVAGKTLNLGRHDSVEKAHAAYVTAKRTHHKGGML